MSRDEEARHEAAAMTALKNGRRILSGFLSLGPPYPTPNTVRKAIKDIVAAAEMITRLRAISLAIKDAAHQCESAPEAQWDWDLNGRVAAFLSTLAMLVTADATDDDTEKFSVASATGMARGKYAIRIVATLASSLYMRYNAAAEMAASHFG